MVAELLTSPPPFSRTLPRRQADARLPVQALTTNAFDALPLGRRLARARLSATRATSAARSQLAAPGACARARVRMRASHASLQRPPCTRERACASPRSASARSSAAAPPEAPAQRDRPCVGARARARRSTHVRASRHMRASAARARAARAACANFVLEGAGTIWGFASGVSRGRAARSGCCWRAASTCARLDVARAHVFASAGRRVLVFAFQVCRRRTCRARRATRMSDSMRELLGRPREREKTTPEPRVRSSPSPASGTS